MSATAIAGRNSGSVILPEALQGARSVGLGRIIELPGDPLQAGEQQQRHERRRLPDVGENHHRQRVALLAEPDDARAREPERVEHVFTNPSSGSNIVRQMIAVTTVRIPHGTGPPPAAAPAREMPRAITSAMASPITSSSVTEMPVNTNVVRIASQNSDELSAVAVVVEADEPREPGA